MRDDRTPPPSSADPDVQARWLVAQAAEDQGAPPAGGWLVLVCRAATTALSLRGSVIHVVTAGGVSSVAASSDEASARIADLAFTTGEGPSVDAFAQRRPVLRSDLLADSGRWPGFTEAAVAAGVRAVFSLPLQIGGARLGVLDLYADQPRRLDEGELALTLAFARLGAHLLLGDPPGGWEGDTWEPLLHHRAEVHQAQGMVMVDLKVDLAEALLRMRAFAYAEGIALIDLAQVIIAGFVLPAAERARGEE